MPQVWGEDAAVFNPSRWFKENGESISFSPFSKSICSSHESWQCRLGGLSELTPCALSLAEYHSWNAGPRSCLGRALATYEGITIVVAVLQRFDVLLADTTGTYEPLAALNMVRL